jgi:hypothetical protein
MVERVRTGHRGVKRCLSKSHGRRSAGAREVRICVLLEMASADAVVPKFAAFG